MKPVIKSRTTKHRISASHVRKFFPGLVRQNLPEGRKWIWKDIKCDTLGQFLDLAREREEAIAHALGAGGSKIAEAAENSQVKAVTPVIPVTYEIEI
jgi:hypothetical protein